MRSEFPLPEGWKETTLGQLGRYLNGRAFKTSEWSRAGRPIIRIQDLTGSNRNPNYFEGDVPDRYVVRPGDLLISWAATLGAYVWDGPEGVLNQHIFKVESNINRRFHYHLVRERIAALQQNAHGSGMVHVTKGVFESTQVAIPVEETEQSLIASVIDEADRLHESACLHLLGARHAAERLRRSILDAACSGRLTDNWRRTQVLPDSLENSLMEALSRRKKQARGRFQEPSLNEHAGKPDLPSQWTIAPLGLVLESIKYGTSKKSEYDVAGTPVLRIPNVSKGRIELTDLKRAILTEKEVRELSLRDSDVLMIRSNGSPQLVGLSVQAGAAAEGMAFAGYLMRLRCDGAILNPAYLALALSTWLVRRQVEMPLRSTSGVNNINTSEVRSLGIPLPPLAEQDVIVQRVATMTAQADSLLDHIETMSRAVELIPRAVLARAFCGELAGRADEACGVEANQ